MKALIWDSQVMEVVNDIPSPANIQWQDCPANCHKDWKYIDSQFVPFSRRTQSSASRSLNSVFQVSTDCDALVHYSVDIACTLSLTTGQTGTVFLEMATDSGFTTGVQELGRAVNGNTGSLTIGLNLTQNATGTLNGYVPAGYYVRLRTANTVGTPTFTYRSGQEVLF